MSTWCGTPRKTLEWILWDASGGTAGSKPPAWWAPKTEQNTPPRKTVFLIRPRRDLLEKR